MNRNFLQQALVGMLLLCLASCNSNPNNGNGTSNSNVTPNAAVYQEAKTTLKQQEEASPLNYLKATGTFRKNLFGTFVIEGHVTSIATVAKFKDAVLKVSFVTKTNTVLGSEDFARYEYIGAGQSIPFTIKTNAPKGTEKIDIDVIRATTTN